MSEPHTNNNVKKIHWKAVNKRKSKTYVIPPSKPNSAKEDLKRFVQVNQLCYHSRKDALTDFENLFEQLNLNNDDDLLDRAERRDLPPRIQMLWNRNKQPLEKTALITSKRPLSSHRSIPLRRSVVPNVILDDYAFRKYNKNRSYSQPSSLPSQAKDHNVFKFNPNNLYYKDKPFCYMELASYDDSASYKDASIGYVGAKLDQQSTRSMEKHRDPDIIGDDVLNRKIRQSSGARVPPPQPPFGIPNSPVISFIHTFPESDYLRVEPDLKELQKRRYRSLKSIPHLINDDMAFRNLRKEINKSALADFPDKPTLIRSKSECDVTSTKPRYRSSSVTSSYASTPNSSPLSDYSLPT